jgi:hypothetical protein
MDSWVTRWLTPALILVTMAGCGHTTITHTTDPVVVSKRPIESKAQFRPPSQIASLEAPSPSANEIDRARLTVRCQAP